MNPYSTAILLLGSGIALLSGIGMLRFSTPYARFHAAGKASPVAFLLASAGAGIELGWGASALLLVASIAMVLTLPVGVHLLFRAVHRTTPGDHLVVDDLRVADRDRGGDDDRQPPRRDTG